MAIPNPNPNIADGIKSDNKTYSSNKIESLISTSQLPEIGEGDEGKVVTVGSDGYELDTPVAPESIIDDSAASADTVYSSSKVNDLLSDKADTSDVDNASVTISRQTGVSESVYLPTAIRRGHVVTILFDGSLAAGTYNSVSSGGTWKIDVLPRAKTTNFVVCDGTKGVAVLPDGTVGFYSNATLASTATIVGSITFITGE